MESENNIESDKDESKEVAGWSFLVVYLVKRHSVTRIRQTKNGKLTLRIGSVNICFKKVIWEICKKFFCERFTKIHKFSKACEFGTVNIINI